jgi:protein ImuB
VRLGTESSVPAFSRSLAGKRPLTALALEFSPVVEETGPGTVVFDVSGLDRLFGHPQELAAAIARRAAEVHVKANLALADNPDAAICAARGFSGVHVIPRGDEGKFLGELPLDLLEPSAELRTTLERWGIRRFRDLAALAPLGIAERLGPEGLRLRERARGEAERKLAPVEEPARFEDSIEPECPVDLLCPLEFLLARLLNGLATRLATRGLATDELRLRLTLETRAIDERTLRLPAPTLDSKAMLKLMRLDLEAHPPPAPVVHVWLGTRPVKPRAAQGGLYAPMAPEPVKLCLTLARIRMVVGDGRVGTPELLDTHRPDAFRMTEFGAGKPRPGGRPRVQARLALRRFRPPRRARVTIADGKPGFVTAEGIRGQVLDLAGPWRTSGEWWTAGAWSRDEWDIALSDGALYRIYCEEKGWFVEGSYD